MDRELAALLRQLSTSDSGGYMANAISGARINRGVKMIFFTFTALNGQYPDIA
jgi:hypothetical protein